MAERPLLILPAPDLPAARRNKPPGRGGKLHLPSRARQDTRISPQFTVLQQVLEAQRLRLQTEAAGIVPEEVIVLETVEPVDKFAQAVSKIDGLEWLAEIEEEDIPPDDDFFVKGKAGARRDDKTLRGRVFLILTNQQAMQQLLALWTAWKNGQSLDLGLAKWGNVFQRLRDVRPWGVRDRLIETGVLEDWQERVDHHDEVVPCEVELWFRRDAQRRQIARDRIVSLVQSLQGQVVAESQIEEIGYHALLLRMPIASVQPLLSEAGRDTALVQCEQIQFFRAAGQMAGAVADDTRLADQGQITAAEQLGDPVVALFDGLPLQNHRRLVGRLVVDDPDGLEGDYPAADRRHGTAMASLILHGDLDSGEPPLGRRLYVRPILRPDPHDWRSPRWEAVSEASLVVDLIHRDENARQFKEYITRLLGYGVAQPGRVRECTAGRVTAISGARLAVDKAHVHRFPLPPSLSGQGGQKRLVVTLATLTPVNTSHQAWRRADVWFHPDPSRPPKSRDALTKLRLDRDEADARSVQRGTVQHEVLAGSRAAAFVDGDDIEIQVSCRADAGALEEEIPYALAVTLEIAPEIGIDIYQEVKTRVHARVQVAQGI